MRKRLSENENGNGDRENAERTNSSSFLHFSGFEIGNGSLAGMGGYSGVSMFSARCSLPRGQRGTNGKRCAKQKRGADE